MGQPPTTWRSRSVVADLIREAARVSTQTWSAQQAKVLRRIVRCQTGELGAHLLVCDDCDKGVVVPNSCRDRHCPRCQRKAQADWAEARAARVLPVPHFQLVFTLPAELRVLALRHPRELYDAFFAAVAETLHVLGDQRLGARLGFTAVLHTWNRELLLHPHLHVLVSAGGLGADGRRWVSTGQRFLFPVKVMRVLYREKLLTRLELLVRERAVTLQPWAFRELRRRVRTKSWRIHVERPEGRGPEQVVRYLARYVYRVAIDDRRVVAFDDDTVTFVTRGTATRTVARAEFLRRFLSHVLPAGLRKTRHFGLYAPGHVNGALVAARARLTDEPNDTELDEHEDEEISEPSVAPPCPHCGSASTSWASWSLASPKGRRSGW